MCLPRGELERAGDQNDHADRDRHVTRQRRLPHLERRQRDAERIGGDSEHGPDEEVPQAHERGESTELRLARRADGFAVARSMGTRDGIIIATIMTTHMQRNAAAASSQV